MSPHTAPNDETPSGQWPVPGPTPAPPQQQSTAGRLPQPNPPLTHTNGQFYQAPSAQFGTQGYERGAAYQQAGQGYPGGREAAAGQYGPGPGTDQPQYYGAATAAFDTNTGLTENFRQDAFTTELKPKPQSGWRKAVLKSTFGLINPGESKVEREDRERRERIRANIPRHEFIYAVLSPRGGVSKTTTTAAVGSIFAQLRGAEVIAVDANPSEGNLASRINPQAQHTFVDLLRDRALNGVNDIRQYTGRNAAHLDVLAASQAYINPDTYTPKKLIDTIDVLRTGYRIIGIDCGQNLNDDVMATILDVVTAVVIVSGVQFDSGRAALRLHDWMLAHGRSKLLERSFLVMSDRTPEPNPKMRENIENSVAGIVWKDPVYVPYDPHLHEATVINLEQLAKPTYRAYLEVASRLSAFYGAPPLPAGRPPAAEGWPQRTQPRREGLAG
ncbi:hypothetical protein EB74_30055 [Mycobacterium sp. SWH-M5]|nr:hypothetical protein EB74_30055 [Mycobacterium sp. SWH-M5]